MLLSAEDLRNMIQAVGEQASITDGVTTLDPLPFGIYRTEFQQHLSDVYDFTGRQSTFEMLEPDLGALDRSKVGATLQLTFASQSETVMEIRPSKFGTALLVLQP